MDVVGTVIVLLEGSPKPTDCSHPWAVPKRGVAEHTGELWPNSRVVDVVDAVDAVEKRHGRLIARLEETFYGRGDELRLPRRLGRDMAGSSEIPHGTSSSSLLPRGRLITELRMRAPRPRAAFPSGG